MNKYKYISFRKKDISEIYFNPIKNQEYFCKPSGGIWASTYTPNDKYLSEWHEFCCENFWSSISENAVVFNLKTEAKIYTIDNMEDLVRFTEKYEFKGPIPEIFSIKCYDFERAAKNYDAIHLTSKGQWETRMPMDYTLPNFNGWDVESILIMNFDVIGKWEYIKIDNSKYGR